MDVKTIADSLERDELAGLIRCDAGRPFADTGVVKALKERKLVQENAWKPTKLGSQVVAKACGVPYRPSSSSKTSRKGLADAGMYVAPAAVADASRDCMCSTCSKVIPKGDPVIWKADVGVFHPDCAPA